MDKEHLLDNPSQPLNLKPADQAEGITNSLFPNLIFPNEFYLVGWNTTWYSYSGVGDQTKAENWLVYHQGNWYPALVWKEMQDH